MWTLAKLAWGWISGGGLTGVVGSILGHRKDMATIDLEAFQGGTKADVAKFTAYLDFTLENNRLKLAQNAWWGAKAIIMICAGSCAFHFAAVMFDSVPFWIPLLMSDAHVVGSWRIPKPPPPYDDYQGKIILSFFLVAPAMPVLQSFSAWLVRK